MNTHAALGLTMLAVLLPAAGRADEKTDGADADAARYTLRYKFKPGETVRWEVEHRAKIRTTAMGNTQTAETASDSVKVWRIHDVDAEGRITFIHLVESVRMRQKLSGREEVEYNSETDETPPPGFADAARHVGVPLTEITMDARGQVVRRENKVRQVNDSQGQMTIPLPEQEVAVGETWKESHTITVPRRDGTYKQVKTMQRYTLQRVSHGVASVAVETVILTPIHDKSVEAQLVQRETQGTVKFDIEAGRVIGQDLRLDKRVIGAPAGEGSSMHYVMRFVETLQPAEPRTTRRPEKPAGPKVYGPEPPPEK